MQGNNFLVSIFPHQKTLDRDVHFEKESTDDSDSDLPELYDASESDGQKSPPSKVRIQKIPRDSRSAGVLQRLCPKVFFKGCELRIWQT